MENIAQAIYDPCKIGENKTKHLTHFETIEMLRSSHRPLVLTLEPKQLGYLSAMRDYMAELVGGWKYSATTGLLGSNVDLTAKFMSIMSVLLAKMEIDGSKLFLSFKRIFHTSHVNNVIHILFRIQVKLKTYILYINFF